jgi:acetolactate synthase I/II/III large subunit
MANSSNAVPTPLTVTGLKTPNTVAHAVIRALKRHGVTCTFGQSLPTMIQLSAEHGGIKQIAYRTENAGGYMADAYARVSGKPGIVTAQNGPAAALLVAPLGEALKASIPVIALVQDVSRLHHDKNAFQDLDHIGMFSPVAKWVRRVGDASRVDDYVDQAFAMACSGRPGPVVLLLPSDLLLEPAVETGRRASLGHFPLDPVVASTDSVRRAADLLCKAKQPLVIAGGGVHLSHGHLALTRLMDEAHLPVATTVMGKGSVDEQHPLAVGVVGYFMGPNGSTRYQRDLVAHADVVLLVGNRTNQNGTDSWQLYPKDATFIHLDIDGTEVGRNYEALRLVGDARLTLDALADALGQCDLTQRTAARAELEASIAKAKENYRKESEPVRVSAQSPIRPERVMHELQKRLTAQSIVVADASYSSIWIANCLTSLASGMRFITPRGLAGLGWGFPMALGAKVARPDSEVFCLVGDGGFGHVWSELETARRMGIKVTLLLLNNGILGYQKHAENVKFGEHTSAVDFYPVDHAAIARSCGCMGVRVSDPAQLAQALEDAAKSEVTALIEVMTDENAFPPITFYTANVK